MNSPISSIVTDCPEEISLLKELQQTTGTHKKLDKGIEWHHINPNLGAITKEKRDAKTAEQVIDILKKEQKFLSQLHGTLKHPDHHGQTCSINSSRTFKKVLLDLIMVALLR